MNKEKIKKAFNFSLNTIESTTNRYIEAEKELGKLVNMPWYKYIFYKPKLRKFLESRLKKYNY